MAVCRSMVLMADKSFILKYLKTYFDELEPKEFYRMIFPLGELANHEQKEVKGKYNAIAVELLPKADDNINARRYVITDELDIIDKLIESDNFIIVSPISYAGRSRTSSAARFIYALAIDLDGITKEQNLIDLFHQIEIDYLPKPTFVVFSGHGLHLYYQFEKPIPCFKNIVKQLQTLKNALTKKIWNAFVTELYDKPQIQSLFQGFRIVGGVTKDGDRTRAFEVGNLIDIEYLNSFVDEEYTVKEIVYKSNLTLKEAAAKYPNWFQKRIVEQKPKGTWTCNRALYDWWKQKLLKEASVGHRYYCCMVLAIYAKKCGIDREELERDAYELVKPMETLTTDENNHFTRQDIFSALEMYNDNYITFPIETIKQLTDVEITRNKRNWRKQKVHLKIIRSNKMILKEEGLMKREGRPTKEKEVKEWREANPAGTKAQCIKDTGISKKTVYKYWES